MALSFFRSLPLQLKLADILNREFNRKAASIKVVGNRSSLPLAFLFSQETPLLHSKLPHIIIMESLEECYKFQQLIEFFDLKCSVETLEAYDVSPYSGLENKSSLSAERIRFLYKLNQNSQQSIFLIPVPALLQKTIPVSLLNNLSITFQKNSVIDSNVADFLNNLGYQSTSYVEDVGQYSIRGGIVDIFSPYTLEPYRFELFGDEVQSIRHFSCADQRSKDEVTRAVILPAKEALYLDENLESIVDRFHKDLSSTATSNKPAAEDTIRSLSRKQYFSGYEFFLPYFYKQLNSVFDFIPTQAHFWIFEPLACQQAADQLTMDLKSDFQTNETAVLVKPDELFINYSDLDFKKKSIVSTEFSTLSYALEGVADDYTYPTHPITEFGKALSTLTVGTDVWIKTVQQKISTWKDEDYSLFIAVKNKSQSERLKHLLELAEYKCHSVDSFNQIDDDLFQHEGATTIVIVNHFLPESLKLDREKIIFLRDEDFFGKKTHLRSTAAEDFSSKAQRLSFGDLKPNDLIVHILHGVGIYDGLKKMAIGGVDSEFIQISYKDKDKLYLPVYRIAQIQKYSGANSSAGLDKLGGTSWEKAKVKVKSHLKDIASELLALYAQRAELFRNAFALHEADLHAFEAAFPYDETEDQLRSINDIYKDMNSTKPMDRLICGDVGFGKTEVAMRAAFVCAHNRKQVAVLAPTTVLSFQHLETFKKRFKGWPLEIQAVNRFVSNAEAKKILQNVKDGKVDILIGTHRLLSKDVVFKDLGLLVIDEEQKFGVTHKEKIKKLKACVDTIAMSATPIPRTLNMSLVGIRDLSLINSAPVDRLPTRTFICKFEETTIRKAIESEIARGGQIYFIHNRVQSIYGVADELRQIVPNARIKVGHGQMEEHQLEETMLAFFNHEIDILLCTTIVESGMDVPKANTMFIDQAHTMGLSQLYQLRGRVGRSKHRAYCYLLLPRERNLEKNAQERLKVIQENTALGSGLKIAQYDLELRGSGNILGENQSGHIDAVGYELYMDLLNEAIQSAKGLPVDEKELEPEINLRIPALIPDSYIADIRIRLSYYKALTEIKSHDDLEKIEEELKDQFGDIPEPLLNLMGLMLIRSQCKKLGVRDVSAGLKNVSLIFTEKTKLKPEVVIGLAMKENKKYSLTPDQRLNIRLNNISWPAVYEELTLLIKLI